MKVRFSHWWFRLFPGAGFVFYPWMLLKREPSQTPTKLFRHELQHVYQVQKEGWLKFYLTWIYYTARYGYKGNPYEVEANAVENDPLTEQEQAMWDKAVAEHEQRN